MRHTFPISLLVATYLLLPLHASPSPLLSWQRTIAIGTRPKLVANPSGGFFIPWTSGPGVITKYTDEGDSSFSITLTDMGIADLSLTPDSGYAVIGGSNDLIVMKFDHYANLLWLYEHSAQPEDVRTAGKAILAKTNGGIIAAGSIFYPGRAPYEDVLTIVLDSEGDTVSTYRYGSPYNDDASIIGLAWAQGNTFLLASATSASNWTPAGLGVRANLNGYPLWSRGYGYGDGFQKFTNCYWINNWISLFVGSRYRRSAPSGYDVVLYKCNANGGPYWEYSDPVPGDQAFWAVCESSDSNYLAVGTGEGGKALITEITPQGSVYFDTLLTDIQGRGGTLTDVLVLPNGGFVTAGIITQGPGWLIGYCREGSDFGNLSPIFQNEHWTGFKLTQVSGEIEEVIFPNVPDGTIGHVSGDAGRTWSVSPDGDGNNGDSIIYRATESLTSGSIDTFWVSKPLELCSMLFKAGCHRDTVKVWNGHIDSVNFWAGHVGNHIELRVNVVNESNIARYEIWGRDLPSRQNFTLRTSVDSENRVGQHSYALTHSYPYYQFLLKAVDQSGCTIEFSDLLLTVGENTGASDNPYPFLPHKVAIAANPNPFNSSTRLEISLLNSGIEEIKLFDVLGRMVLDVEQNFYPAGKSFVQIDASLLASGVYFATLNGEHQIATCKLLLLK